MTSATLDEVGQDTPGEHPAPAQSSPRAQPARRLLDSMLPILRQSLQMLGAPRLLKRQPRRLRLSETLSLGDKRFVAIVEVDGSSFLIGGGSAGVALLKQLESAPQSSPCFDRSMQLAAEKEFG